MSFKDDRKALTREKRLSSLSHFNGTLEALIDEVSGADIKQKIRTFSQIHSDEIIYAFDVLSKIEDASIVVNGAAGCASIGLSGSDPEFGWYGTELVERDTILGGDQKLREAVLRAYEEKHPKAVFIIGTPVVAINNDDINSVILELEDELDIPIISIYTDGFKTKNPVSGYDIVTHSILKYLVDSNADEKEDFINVVSFSESIEDIAAVVKILNALDIEYRVIPRFSVIDEIRSISRAKATIVLNPEEGEYLAKELEEVYKVPYIVSEPPIGYRGTKKFIRKIADFLNITNKADRYIEEAEGELSKSIKKDLLKGQKIFIDASLSKIPAYSRLIDNLGGEIIGIGAPFVDLENRKNLMKLDFISRGTNVVIGNGQYFEKANTIAKQKADIYVSQYPGSSFAIDEGACVVSVGGRTTYGFDGVRSIYNAFVQVFRSKAKLGSGENSIYKNNWKSKSGNWYVKQEVS
ncbi:MAG: nitrogenase component 1 [Lachnospiraceae bacterium]|nr:nitrogenase component 1 [Lachnospiraceae bacterium]